MSHQHRKRMDLVCPDPPSDPASHVDRLCRIALTTGEGWARCGYDVCEKVRQRSPHWTADPRVRSRLIVACFAGAYRGGPCR
jgi:hypothetical protein